jgi:hypothetical protein
MQETDGRDLLLLTCNIVYNPIRYPLPFGDLVGEGIGVQNALNACSFSMCLFGQILRMSAVLVAMVSKPRLRRVT